MSGPGQPERTGPARRGFDQVEKCRAYGSDPGDDVWSRRMRRLIR